MRTKMSVGLAAIAFVASTMGVSAYPTQTTGATFLHTGPGAKYSLVAPVPPGAIVNVQLCAGGWCRLVWTQYAGYMPAALLASASNSPAPTHAPPPVADYAYPWDCDADYDATCNGYDDGGYGYLGGVYRGHNHGWRNGHAGHHRPWLDGSGGLRASPGPSPGRFGGASHLGGASHSGGFGGGQLWRR